LFSSSPTPQTPLPSSLLTVATSTAQMFSSIGRTTGCEKHFGLMIDDADKEHGSHRWEDRPVRMVRRALLVYSLTDCQTELARHMLLTSNSPFQAHRLTYPTSFVSEHAARLEAATSNSPFQAPFDLPNLLCLRARCQTGSFHLEQSFPRTLIHIKPGLRFHSKRPFSCQTQTRNALSTV